MTLPFPPLLLLLLPRPLSLSQVGRRSRVRDPPPIEPFQVRVLAIAALHAKHDGTEEDKQADDGAVQDRVDAPSDLLVQCLRGPIQAEAGGQDGEVEGRIVVVHIRDSGHGDEGKVVQEPADGGIDAGVVDLVDIGLAQLLVASLPADQVPQHEETGDGQ